MILGTDWETAPLRLRGGKGWPCLVLMGLVATAPAASKAEANDPAVPAPAAVSPKAQGGRTGDPSYLRKGGPGATYDMSDLDEILSDDRNWKRRREPFTWRRLVPKRSWLRTAWQSVAKRPGRWVAPALAAAALACSPFVARSLSATAQPPKRGQQPATYVIEEGGEYYTLRHLPKKRGVEVSACPSAKATGCIYQGTRPNIGTLILEDGTVVGFTRGSVGNTRYGYGGTKPVPVSRLVRPQRPLYQAAKERAR